MLAPEYNFLDNTYCTQKLATTVGDCTGSRGEWIHQHPGMNGEYAQEV